MNKTLTRVVRFGSRGGDVIQIQQLLNPFTPRLNTIDGNLIAGRIQRRTGHHRVGKDNFNYYSLK